MSHFFRNLDKIYCLCIEERKKFVIDQFTKLNVMDKIFIIDAYRPNSSFVDETIQNHLVYTVHTDNLVSIACTLGIREILLDIIKNKYQYAMVIEDDVLFLENMFVHANKWLNPDTISKYINTSKPYVLYLQSSINEKTYYNPKKSAGGIFLSKIRYGEPAYITNFHACTLLLKYMFPITSQYDEYKHIIKSRFNIQEAILVPYICRELSGNYFNYNTLSLDYSFERNFKVNYNSLFNKLSGSTYYLNTSQILHHNDLISFLISGINPIIKYLFQKPHDAHTMYYSICNHETSIGNNYLLSASFNDDIEVINNNAFIISVRGLNSYNTILKKFGIKTFIGDILLLFSRFYPKKINVIYKYCFIFNMDEVKIICNDTYIFINPCKIKIDIIIQSICNSNFVITNDINYISISNSYSIKGIYASPYPNINDEFNIISSDYYSNITSQKIEPLNLNCQNNIITIDYETEHKINNFIQPTLPIKHGIIEQLLDIIPFRFNLHKNFKKNNKYVQIIHSHSV